MKNKNLALLLGISFVIRSVIAFNIELNNDEVYYWTYAQKLQWNYFDHPPGIAILLKIFTLNLSFTNEFFLRLGSMLCSAISTWLVYLIGKKIKNPFCGYIAALLFTASPYCSIIAGILVMPDSPQLVFWLWGTLLMLEIIEPASSKQKTNQRLLILGIVIGCCILCKVHGIFLWFGFLLYISFFQRKLLTNPFLFFALLITAIFVIPIIAWNISNDFISYRFHSNRVSFFSTVQIDGFFRELFGEILYNNPVNVLILLLALIAIFKTQRLIALPQQRLLVLLSFPLIGLVLFMSLFRDTLPHWTGPAYCTLIPLMSAYVISKNKISAPVPPVVKWAIAFTIILLIPAYIIVKWLPYNLGDKTVENLGAGDPTLDMNGFKELGYKFDSLLHDDLKNGRINPSPFLLSDKWFPAAHIDYYVAHPEKLRFLAIGNLTSIHNYAWLNRQRPFLENGCDAYFITLSNYFRQPPAELIKQFDKLYPPTTITQFRSGIPVRNFFVYRLTNYHGNLSRNGLINNQ